jgi:exodeoxyribonuclease VII small subunit
MAKKIIKNSFEANLSRLEEISALLESNNLKLEDAISLFEEGIALSRICVNTLKDAELKVTELKKKLEDISLPDDEESED